MKRSGIEELSRRQFVKTAAVAAATATVAFPYVVRGATDDKPIRFGVVGCGGRGQGACRDAMAAAPNVKLTAAADLYEDRLSGLRGKVKDLVELDSKYCFKGHDAYKKVLEMDLDYIILATPPHFRPLHLPACIEAGKHVFMEKPAAVDPVGIRKILAAGEAADKKKLCIAAGTQRRHEAGYIETIKRIHDGEIGRIYSAQVYWNGGPLAYVVRDPSMSDEEWMIRDWFQWRWLSGDHVVEQHVHNVDVANWVLKAHPIKASAMGGRHRRKQGDQYDFFCADLAYPGEIHVHSECRQIPDLPHNVSERVVGEKGWSDCHSMFFKDGKVEKLKVQGRNPYVQEHADLIAAIRDGKHINEAKNVAESTMCNIMIREAAYSGEEVLWDDLIKSDLELKKPDYELTPENVKAHVPIPGSDAVPTKKGKG
jgi:myo-inositol 2-dehydrogenase/D-chiro-inositol 1-dehydrogenase